MTAEQPEPSAAPPTTKNRGCLFRALVTVVVLAVVIGDGEIRADLSLPLERMGYPERWFNGSAAFAVTLENGVLTVTLRSVSVKGEPVPEWIVGKLGDRNLAKDLYDKPETAGFVARL